MGISAISDAFSHKYITMQIFGRDGSWYLIPMRGVTTGTAIVKIAGQCYPFIVDPRKIQTYRYKGAKTIQTILYSLEDMLPLDLGALSRLREHSEASGIKQYDENVMTILKRAVELLGDTDEGLISVDSIESDMKARGEDVGRIVQDFLARTGVTQVVRPVPELMEYLVERMTISPSHISTLLYSMQRMDWEHRKISNPAKTPFQHWLALILGVAGIGGALGVIALGFDAGWFDSSGDGVIEDILSLASLYDSPEDAVKAGVKIDGVELLPAIVPEPEPVVDTGIVLSNVGPEKPDQNVTNDTLKIAISGDE